MRVTINLAKTSGRRELVEVIRAVEAVKPPQRSRLDPVELLSLVIDRAVSWALKWLDTASHQWVCRHLTPARGKRLQARCLKLTAQLWLVKNTFWARWRQALA